MGLWGALGCSGGLWGALVGSGELISIFKPTPPRFGDDQVHDAPLVKWLLPATRKKPTSHVIRRTLRDGELPLFEMINNHVAQSGEPPDCDFHSRYEVGGGWEIYYAYYECDGEQSVFLYDRRRKRGELLAGEDWMLPGGQSGLNPCMSPCPVC